MQAGIIGLPLSGKTTIFNALTGSDAETANYSTGQVQLHTAIVPVRDLRVDALSRMFKPRKTTRAQIQFNDITGISKGGVERHGFDPQVLAAMSKCDALLQVVRAYEAPMLAEGVPDPLGDLESLRLELVISDLAIIERRLERIQGSMKKARAAEKTKLGRERALLERLEQALDERLLSDLDLSDEENCLIRGFQFLTAKPSMVICNLPEEADPDPDLDWANHHRNSTALALKGSLEMEIAQLAGDDKDLFLESYGIEEPGLHRMVRESYELLGLMSFFTVGEDEVRAWVIPTNSTAPRAAAA